MPVCRKYYGIWLSVSIDFVRLFWFVDVRWIVSSGGIRCWHRRHVIIYLWSTTIGLRRLWLVCSFVHLCIYVFHLWRCVSLAEFHYQNLIYSIFAHNWYSGCYHYFQIPRRGHVRPPVLPPPMGAGSDQQEMAKPSTGIWHLI